jgi:hypothetical protein
MVLTELTDKQLREEKARQEAQRLAPQRALYSSTASTAVAIDIKPEEPTPRRPIICDCGKRAGDVGNSFYHCPACEIVIRVSPGLGRVEFTLEQYADTLGPNQLDLDKITEDAEASSKLEILNPEIY